MRRNQSGRRVAFILLCGLAFSVLGSWSLVTAFSPATGDQRPATIQIAEYVPLENGRTWTYQWEVRSKDGAKRTTSRTKGFEGPEFLPTGYAYKFVSDLGDYVLLSVEGNSLRMHGSVEPHRSIRFIFDPPVSLFSPEMEVNREYTTTQQDGDGAQPRTWTTRVEGFEDVDTPMGKFSRCLKLRLEMKGDGVQTSATYYYARWLGLVFYTYTSRTEGENQPEIAIDARLKLAQVGGQMITSASQLETLGPKLAARSTGPDNPQARNLFKAAFDRLYFWAAEFPGFKADFTLERESGSNESKPISRGAIVVSADWKMKTNSNDKEAATQVETEVSQFITHLKNKPFDVEYGAAIFTLGGNDPEKGQKIDVSAEKTMGTSYRVKEGRFAQIEHSYGRVRFLIDHTGFMQTGDGRFIATSYRITYYSNETDEIIGSVDFEDEYVKVENAWLPKRRVKTETAKGKTTRLVLEFSNHQIRGTGN